MDPKTPNASAAIADRAFSSFPFYSPRVTLDRQFPSYLTPFSSLEGGGEVLLAPGDAHYGYVYAGGLYLRYAGPDDSPASLPLSTGMAFSVNGPARLELGVHTRGVVVSREGHRAFNVVTGPIEQAGRLKYIDGCTDSLLIPPVRKGDPCLNLLYFPAGIDQTSHVHPSDRIGLILSGHGLCHAWEKGRWGTIVERKYELVPGMVFCIHTNGQHKFSTPFGDEMRVLAYHPESDFGPTDEDHPMINKTLVDVAGERVSASKVREIATR